MVQINFAKREVQCKVVYYGPARAGKTANLRWIHQRSPESVRGQLTTIATDTNRTLFFDFLPLDLGEVAGIRTKIQLYAIPYIEGQNAMRMLVLEGVDGIVFVADSAEHQLSKNAEAYDNLRNNLDKLGRDLADIPLVWQWNKSDLPDAMSAEELDQTLNPEGHPAFSAVAEAGTGVFSVLKTMTQAVLVDVAKMMAAAPAPAPVSAATEPDPEPAAEEPSGPEPQPAPIPLPTPPAAPTTEPVPALPPLPEPAPTAAQEAAQVPWEEPELPPLEPDETDAPAVPLGPDGRPVIEITPGADDDPSGAQPAFAEANEEPDFAPPDFIQQAASELGTESAPAAPAVAGPEHAEYPEPDDDYASSGNWEDFAARPAPARETAPLPAVPQDPGYGYDAPAYAQPAEAESFLSPQPTGRATVSGQSRKVAVGGRAPASTWQDDADYSRPSRAQDGYQKRRPRTAPRREHRKPRPAIDRRRSPRRATHDIETPSTASLVAGAVFAVLALAAIGYLVYALL